MPVHLHAASEFGWCGWIGKSMGLTVHRIHEWRSQTTTISSDAFIRMRMASFLDASILLVLRSLFYFDFLFHSFSLFAFQIHSFYAQAYTTALGAFDCIESLSHTTTNILKLQMSVYDVICRPHFYVLKLSTRIQMHPLHWAHFATCYDL